MTTMASQITSLTVVYLTVYSDADQRKHQSSASLAFVQGIHRDRWIPRTKGQLRGKCFHLMTSSWSCLKTWTVLCGFNSSTYGLCVKRGFTYLLMEEMYLKTGSWRCCLSLKVVSSILILDTNYFRVIWGSYAFRCVRGWLKYIHICICIYVYMCTSFFFFVIKSENLNYSPLFGIRSWNNCSCCTIHYILQI